MTTFARHRIRISPDAVSHTPVPDILTSATPIIWRGTSVQVEVGLLFNGSLQTDISNIATLYLEIHRSDRGDTPLVQKSLSAASLTQTLSANDWTGNDPAKYHALFELSYADTQLPLDYDTTLQEKRSFWMVVHAVTTDNPARRLTWGGCNLDVEEDGVQNELSGVPVGNPSVRVVNGILQVINKTTGKYHPIWFEGVEGQETIKWGAGI